MTPDIAEDHGRPLQQLRRRKKDHDAAEPVAVGTARFHRIEERRQHGSGHKHARHTFLHDHVGKDVRIEALVIGDDG